MKEFVIYSASNKDTGSISIKSLPSVYGINSLNLKSIKIETDGVVRPVSKSVITNKGGIRIWCKGTGVIPVYNKLTKIFMYIEE